MMPPRPGVCISCGKWFDYRTKDMCTRCYRTAWMREKRRREYASRPPKPAKVARQERIAKPKREPRPSPEPTLPRGWLAGTTDESRSAWAARFTLHPDQFGGAA